MSKEINSNKNIFL